METPKPDDGTTLNGVPVVKIALDDLIALREQIIPCIEGFRAYIADAMVDLQVIDAEVLRRCDHRQIPHDRLVIRAVKQRGLVKYDSEFLPLRELLGPLTQEEIDSCVHEKTETVLKTDATGLKRLSEKYAGELGDRIRFIRDRALRYVETERLEIKPREAPVAE